MYREIVIPNDADFTIHFPASYIGQRVEIIAFPITKEENIEPSSTQSAKEIDDFYSIYKVKRGSFKFNRLEANNFTDEDWK